MNAIESDFHRIVIEDIPLIDVRAGVEFKAGAFPGAVNLPILDDKERRLVGICYKEKGQDEAIKLGHQLVSGEKKQKRVAAWMDFIHSYPQAMIYCFRGGLRSQIAQQWLEEETGISTQRLEGGYKALRNYCIKQLDPAQVSARPLIVGGRTGVGKTLLLHQLDNAIDLEAIANHRGSAFGRFLTPQPSQVDFENRLACALIKHGHQGHHSMVLEDEGSYIGSCSIPAKLVQYFNGHNLVLLQASLEQRVQVIFDEYVIRSQAAYEDIYGVEEGMMRWLADMNQSVTRIKKRLGAGPMRRTRNLLESAWQKQLRTGNGDDHKCWIEILLGEYYDPMYDYQLRKKSDSIIFKGTTLEVLEFLNHCKVP